MDKFFKDSDNLLHFSLHKYDHTWYPRNLPWMESFRKHLKGYRISVADG